MLTFWTGVDAGAGGLNEGAVVVVQVFTNEQRCQQKLFTFRPGSGTNASPHF